MFCWGFFHHCSPVILTYNFVFVCVIFGLGIRPMLTSQNEFESVPSIAIFGNSLRRISVGSSLNFGRIHLWNLLVRDFFIYQECFLRFNFITGNWSVHILYCTILRICPYLLSCLFYWHRVVHSSCLCSFVFLSFEL